ncbi:hypothetical protein QUF75_06400 [Desulfococcaceae bacterium HSG7]|nr:hypothetical protein [Desulfococcaceae bacterium HSG7]
MTNPCEAIARMNRVYKEKSGGLVADYLGIASDLKKSLSLKYGFTNSIGCVNCV